MMMRSLLLCLAACPSLAAAPPKVDFLFPGGGQRGRKIEVTLSGTLDPWPVSGWASHPGIQVVPAKKNGQCTIAVAAEVPCGVHWVRFFNSDGASGLRPFLVNQLAEVADSEPNDEPKKPQPIKLLPVIVNGRLDKPNDTDVFAVDLKKGQTLVASVEANQTLRSPMDAVLQIVSADGFVLAQNDDHAGIDPFIAFHVPRDAVYLVRLFCFPSLPDSRVGLHGKENCVYRLTLTTGPYVDHAWPLAIQRDKPGAIELIGWSIPAEARTIEVRPEKDSSHVVVQPEGFANSARVRIEPHSCVRLADVSAPVTITGRVKDAAGEKITFSARKGAKLTMEIETRELHFPLDPVLIVLDPSGKQVQRVQAGKLNTDPSLVFTPVQDGRHTLLVRDLHEEGGPRHVFRLRLLESTPDFDVALTADILKAPAGKPLELPITITRRHGFKEDIVFTAEGLPDARVEFAPAKDPKSNKLVLHGVKESNRAFRLFAMAKGREETRRPVLTALPDFGTSLPYLWIGATAK